jgi:hypothetical protein
MEMTGVESFAVAIVFAKFLFGLITKAERKPQH